MRLLTVDDLAARLQLHRATIYEWVARGDMPPPIKLGRSSRWPEAAIDEWIAEQIRRQTGGQEDER